MVSDFFIVIRWWSVFFLIGAAAFPLTRFLFRGWHDQGYLFSKAVGLATVGWFVFVFGMAHIAPFTVSTIGIATAIVFLVGILLSFSYRSYKTHKTNRSYLIKTVFFEELFFLAALLFWTWVKAHEPSIRGLEKFMDYGFMQSLLNSTYFPATDMWYPPYPINYYYFGHLVTAILTKVSGLDLSYTFNLMLSTIFAFCFTMSFSIGRELLESTNLQIIKSTNKIRSIIGGLFTAFLVTLAGNMQTLYAFTKGYTGDNVKPFWELWWNIREIGGIEALWGKLGDGMNTYWYANATRFIPYTIHEFPSYSFVVSDVHGHVLSIPFVLLAIALLIQIFKNKSYKTNETNTSHLFSYIFYGYLCGILLMTNALDGPIYVGLFCVSLFVFDWSHKTHTSYWTYFKIIGAVLAAAAIASLPFLSHFTSFVNGIAVNCPPGFLANMKIGPLLFEGVEKCQRSPLWMMFLLWGFFWVSGGMWTLSKIRHIRQIRLISPIEKLLMVFFFFSIALIIFPEFFYFKDIYPQHFRSNTMFKLGYEAFILFSIVSGYAIVQLFTNNSSGHRLCGKWGRRICIGALVPMLFLVSIYPLFSVRSYFGGLKNYEGIYGLSWLQREFPDDFVGIEWIKKEAISRQSLASLEPRRSGSVVRRSDSWKLKADSLPILVEADGDSYTDYQRFSAFTGIPTVVGWAVHEWLWRGGYDAVSPRREDVRRIYESQDLKETKGLLNQYNVRFVIVGTLERQKFTKLIEDKFTLLGQEVFRSGETVIYEILN